MQPNTIFEIGSFNDCIMGEYSPAHCNPNESLINNFKERGLKRVPNIRINVAFCTSHFIENYLPIAFTLTLLHELVHWATEELENNQKTIVSESEIDKFLEEIFNAG